LPLERIFVKEVRENNALSLKDIFKTNKNQIAMLINKAVKNVYRFSLTISQNIEV
jgi:hypothetical protein